MAKKPKKQDSTQPAATLDVPKQSGSTPEEPKRKKKRGTRDEQNESQADNLDKNPEKAKKTGLSFADVDPQNLTGVGPIADDMIEIRDMLLKSLADALSGSKTTPNGRSSRTAASAPFSSPRRRSTGATTRSRRAPRPGTPCRRAARCRAPASPPPTSSTGRTPT